MINKNRVIVALIKKIVFVGAEIEESFHVFLSFQWDEVLFLSLSLAVSLFVHFTSVGQNVHVVPTRHISLM